MFSFLSQKKFKVKTFFKEDLELQEVFLDKLAKRKEEEIGISEKKLETPLSYGITVFLIFVIFLSVFLLIGMTFYFQVFQKEEYIALAERNKFTMFSIRAARGIIYDQFYNQLIYNNPGFDLVLNDSFLRHDEEERERTLVEISKITGFELEELTKKVEEFSLDSQKSGKQEIVLLNNLDHNSLVILKSKIDSFSGIEIEENLVRNYIYGETISHIIGYTGKINREEMKIFSEYKITDYIGKSGIEKEYENILRRNSGLTKIERDALGREISRETVSLPEPGKNLVLWLDLELQQKIEEVLYENLERINARKASVIAINPKTGGVLAMVNVPSYDNNIFNFPSENNKEISELLNNPANPLFNRAISGQYPTGSVIKPFIAAGALEEGIITPNKQIYAQGKIEIPHRYDPSIVYTYRDVYFHGLTDMRKAIAASVNVYFYAIGGGYKDQKGLGPTNIKNYLELFGWGNKTEIDLPSEKKGRIPSPEMKRETRNEPWFDGDTYNLSIGQGDIFITPIQVAMSYVAIANGGTLYSPNMLKKIIDNSGNETEIEPKIIRENFINSENMEVIREGMRATVTGENSQYATARSLNYLSEKTAAKTGTAQTPRRGYYNNWIAVFGPYDDPRIVLLVLVEDVEGIQISTIPVARDVLDWYYKNR